MLNCKSLLVDHIYLTAAQATKKGGGANANANGGGLVTIEHEFSPTEHLTFELFNDYMSVPPSRRRDVVCVLVHGPEWQFKNWGFHVRYVTSANS